MQGDAERILEEVRSCPLCNMLARGPTFPLGHELEAEWRFRVISEHASSLTSPPSRGGRAEVGMEVSQELFELTWCMGMHITMSIYMAFRNVQEH